MDEPQWSIPPVARRTLPSGARLAACHSTTSDTTVLSGLIVGGAALDPPHRAGLANLTASVARRATASRSYDQIYDRLDALGASLAMGAGTHAVSFSAKCLAEHWGTVAELVTDVLRQASFPPDEFQRARGEALTSLREADQSTRAVARRELAHLVYPREHPYRWPPYGYHESVAAIERDELVACHRRLFRPDQLILSLVGNVPCEEALERLAELLEPWEAPDEPVPALDLAAQHPPEPQRTEVPMADKSQADLALGCKTISRHHPDYYALAQATHIVGGMGLMGRLGDNVRDRQGLAYYVFAQMQDAFGHALWAVRAGVNPGNVERATSSILDEIRRIQDQPVGEEELADCQSHLVGVLPIRLETNDGLAATLNGIELYHLGDDYVERYPRLVRAVDAESIQRAAQAHLTAERYSVAVAGPRGETG
ncbi:MAG: M16 family metallopeptidase [Candidatus Brocadiia bacterium]